MKWIWFIALLVLSIFLMNVVHETIHLIQYKGEVDEVCFIGYDGDQASGWVTPKDQSTLKNYYEPDHFSLKNLYKFSIQKKEVVPLSLGFLVVGLFLLGVFKTKVKEDENEYLYGSS